MKKFYIYILKCEDSYLYIGITNSLQRRLLQHQVGQCKLTKNRGKIKLVYCQEFSSRSYAAVKEKEIKGWRREKKDELIKKFTLNPERSKG